MLVAAPERWDEACFAVPAIRALMASGLGCGVICREDQGGFWQTLAGLEVLAFPAKARAKAAVPEIGAGWQAGLIWEAGFAADAIKLAGIPRRLGPALRELRKQVTHPLVFSRAPGEHRVRFYLSLIEELGVFTANPEFFSAAEMGVTPVAEALLLCPDSDFGPSHEWPLDRWLELARSAMENGCRVAVAGMATGRNLGKSLAANLGNGCEWFDISLLGQSLGFLAGYRWVVAADGSLPHLAAHAGATCITLFGPNDPMWKRPLGRRHSIVRHHVECAPCLLGKCPMDGRCQRELESARVWKAVQEKLG